MRIVLSTVHASETNKSDGSLPCLGLLYVAASVVNVENISVRVLDPLGEDLNLEEAIERIVSLEPDLFGVYVSSSNVLRARNLAGQVRQALPQTKIIFGGPHPTLYDDLLLREIPELDMVFRGEGEQGFPELCRRLLAREDLQGVPGLSFHSNGKIIRGEPQEMEDVNSLPIPARSVQEYEGYLRRYSAFDIPSAPKAATVLSSRGCPFNCSFCSRIPPTPKKWRPRSADDVFAELLQLKRDSYRFVAFVDENFTRDADRIHRLCELLIEHKIHREMRFAFMGSLQDVTFPVLKLMHRAGFDFVFIGAESGSDDQLRRYHKVTRRKQVEQVITNTRKANIVAMASFITGGPGETTADHEASKDLIRSARPHFGETACMQVIPGSHLWEELVGTGEPGTLEESATRMIYTFPGQLDQETIESRIRDIRKTLSDTWRSWRRLLDVIRLIVRNPSVNYIVRSCITAPKFWYQVLRQDKAPIDTVDQ